MVNLQDPTTEADHEAHLDRVFSALADTTRRRILAQLEQGGGAPVTVSELAQSHAMSLPGFMKHLAVLEAAGLIARAKEGRVVRCALDALPMQEAAMWMDHYAHFWNERLDALGRYLYHQEEINPWNPPANNPPSSPPSRPSTSASSKAKSDSTAATASRPKKSGGRGPSRKP